MTIKHNKKKNTSIIYEQLLTVMTSLLAENKQEEFNFVQNLLYKHFNRSTNLFKEKKIFDSLMSFKHTDAVMAEKFLDECLVESSLISEKELENEKVSLINEVIKSLGKEIFNIPVKEYRLRASAQFLLNEMRNNLKYSTPQDRIKLKLFLIENIQKENKQEEVPKIDNFTLKVLKDKYIKKYSSVLNENQQKILVKWNDYLLNENNNEFNKFINQEYKSIKENIENFIKKNPQNENISLLKEAKEKLKNFSIKEINEDIVYEAMRYWDIIEDLNMENVNNG